MTTEAAAFTASSITLGGAGAVAAFRAAVADVFAVDPVDPDHDAFALDLDAWHLGTIMIGRFRASALHFDRSPALVAASGLDHVLVQLYVDGGFVGEADGLPVTVVAGDIVVFDLTRTLRTVASTFENISLLVPRAMLRERVAVPALLHGMVLPATSQLTALLDSHMRTLASRAALLDPGDAITASAATAALVGTVLATAVPPQTEVRGCASLLRTATAIIDARIADVDLDADTIARLTGASRATLYRLFAPSGGVSAFIRRRRLTGAAIELADRSRPARRVGEIARRWGFGSEAAFHRTFRAAFCISPGTARKQAALVDIAGLGDRDLSMEQRFAEWMRLLHG